MRFKPARGPWRSLGPASQFVSGLHPAARTHTHTQTHMTHTHTLCSCICTNVISIVTHVWLGIFHVWSDSIMVLSNFPHLRAVLRIFSSHGQLLGQRAAADRLGLSQRELAAGWWRGTAALLPRSCRSSPLCKDGISRIPEEFFESFWCFFVGEGGQAGRVVRFTFVFP